MPNELINPFYNEVFDEAFFNALPPKLRGPVIFERYNFEGNAIPVPLGLNQNLQGVEVVYGIQRPNEIMRNDPVDLRYNHPREISGEFYRLLDEEIRVTNIMAGDVIAVPGLDPSLIANRALNLFLSGHADGVSIDHFSVKTGRAYLEYTWVPRAGHFAGIMPKFWRLMVNLNKEAKPPKRKSKVPMNLKYAKPLPLP